MGGADRYAEGVLGRDRATMSYLSVAEMTPGEGDSAYALVRMLDPGIAPACWSAFVEARRADGGILLLRAIDGPALGLASWREVEDAEEGSLLLVENFVTLELSAAAPGRRLLAGAIETLARERGCCGIRGTPGGPGSSAAALRNHLAIPRQPPPDHRRGSAASLTAAEMYPAC